MSDTQSIYKSVLGLNETGGVKFLVYPSNQHIRSDGYYFRPFPVATPITSVSSAHPTKVKIVGLQPSSTLRLLTVDRLFEMRMNSAFSNNPRLFRFSNQFFTWLNYSTFTFQFLSIIFMLNIFNHHISRKHNKIGLFPLYIVYSIL